MNAHAQPIVDRGLMDAVIFGGLGYRNPFVLYSPEDIRLYLRRYLMCFFAHRHNGTLASTFVSKIWGPGHPVVDAVTADAAMEGAADEASTSTPALFSSRDP